MTVPDTIAGLQELIQTKKTFSFEDYFQIGSTFLDYLQSTQLTRIVSPVLRNRHYIFYQYGSEYDNKITRPLNTNLFIESPEIFKESFARFIDFLSDLKRYQEGVNNLPHTASYIQSNEINKIIYTMQQAIGCIGDSFSESNQARKKIGQLFEILVKLTIQRVGLVCEPRTINIPIPGFEGYKMPYELDVVFSRKTAIIVSEEEAAAKYIQHSEIVGSVKTTSKDRIDKVFLDKYLLTKLLQRDIPVIAIFLHDVQRTKAPSNPERSGDRHFNITSTFKTNHFLGYTVALNKLDGIYYVDPRPEMTVNEKLREQIKDFQQFLVEDLWYFSK
jgi:hypothetical protein